MEPLFVTERWEYDYIVTRGYEPLLNTKLFRMDIGLRIAIQREKFGQGHSPEENERFYRWCWEHYPHRCEETQRPLPSFSASYISHILTRGAFPEMAHDPRNINVLCVEMHNKWESGNRKDMKIYRANQMRIEELKKEYQQYKENLK